MFSPTHPQAIQEKTGIRIPQVFLPRPGIDLHKWAVVACDQYTSQPDYWEKVEALVGDSPSTLRLVLPEIYLGSPEEPERVRQIQASMQSYLREGLLQPFEGFIYVERRVEGRTRHGLLACLDLEKYDYTPGSQSLIRATEGTITDRLPPRMKIRAGAPLELPHILVLIDDPEQRVIQPLAARVQAGAAGMEPAYDFDLMLEGGHLAGYRVTDPALEAGIFQGLAGLADPDCFTQKYGLPVPASPLLFAMGDGNHSLATAKAIWEELKPVVGMDHPARYALAEIENVHDEGLVFEPIHRVLFDLRVDLLQALETQFPGKVRSNQVETCQEMIARVEAARGPVKAFGLLRDQRFRVVEIESDLSQLAVGVVQPFLDELLRRGEAGGIDYVHGKCVACKLACQPGTLGLYLPHIEKSDLFKTVILDGALPRKTFSLGEAHEKRYYMEARRII